LHHRTALEDVNERSLHCKVLSNRGILLLYIMNCLCRIFVVSASDCVVGVSDCG